MNLIPIVYNSLLIFSGLFVLILVFSYIFSKLKSNNVESEKKTNNFVNEQINYKKPIYTNNNTTQYQNYTNEHQGFRESQHHKVNSNYNTKSDEYINNKKSNRFKRYNTNSYDFYEDKVTYNKIYYGNDRNNTYDRGSLLSHYADF